jgi:hypothetical protein
MVLPFAVFFKNKLLSNLLLLWSLGALMALVVNTAQAGFEIVSTTFAFYFFPHVFEFGIPILMFKLGLVKKDLKCIYSTLGITFGAYTLIHFINRLINYRLELCGAVDYAGDPIRVNYMYSIVPENPILALFKQIIPYDYWYMLLIIPIAIIYLLAVYYKQLISLFKMRRAAS